MVPAYFLLVALPFVAGGMSNMGGNQDQMMMMQMMMNAMKNNQWDNNNMNMGNMNMGNMGNMNMGNMGNNQQQQPNFSMENKEEYEAYLKWCAENQARHAEQVKQQELLEQFKMRQEAHKQEMEKAKIEMEAKERSENMKAQWKQWESQMEMVQNFDSIGYAVMEMKHKYYYTVVMEFMKFCKCDDFSGEIERFFGHDGVSYKHEEFDLADLGLNAVSGQDAFQVAQALNNISKEDQIKAFFGGLAERMCEGARTYYNQVAAWEKQYRFLERLV